MTPHEKEVYSGVAEKLLKMDIGFGDDGKLYLELGGMKWEFKDLTDAEGIEEISKIFDHVQICMWQNATKKLLSWVSQNKKNFN